MLESTALVMSVLRHDSLYQVKHLAQLIQLRKVLV